MADMNLVNEYIDDLPYPATKDDIVEFARSQGADMDVTDTLDQLPNQDYETPADVEAALGELE
jgi:hypothetical protein